jgi:hypothetical protein
MHAPAKLGCRETLPFSDVSDHRDRAEMEYNGFHHPSQWPARQKARCRSDRAPGNKRTGSRNSPRHRRRMCRLLESKALFVMIVGKPSPRTSSARSSHRWKGQRRTRRMRMKRRPIQSAILQGRRGANPSEGYSTGFGLTWMRGVALGTSRGMRLRQGARIAEVCSRVAPASNR